jgi:hypothetical protein
MATTTTATWNCNAGTNTGWVASTNAYNITNNTYANRNIPKSGADDSTNIITGTAHQGAGTKYSTITKVEIGVEGYTADTLCQPRVVPVFSGTTPGSAYPISPTFGLTDTDTPGFVDITLDAQAPINWTWTDITNLDFRIYGLNSATVNKQLYIDWLRVRVTYNDPPVPTGGINISGSGLYTLERSYSTSGTATLSGSAIRNIDRIIATSGSIILNGLAIHTISFSRSSSGSATLSGVAATYRTPILYTGSGGAIHTGGAAIAMSFARTSSGDMSISGHSVINVDRFILTSGVATLNGSANWQQGGDWIGAGQVIFSGFSDIKIDLILTTSGSIILNGEITQTEVNRTINTSGYVDLDGTSVNQIDIIISTSGSLILSGTFIELIEKIFIASGALTLSETTVAEVDIIISPLGYIELGGGISLTEVDRIYEVSISEIELSGEFTLVTEGYAEYISSGEVATSGSANWQLGGDWIATGEAVLSGSSTNEVDIIFSMSGSTSVSGTSTNEVDRIVDISGYAELSGTATEQIDRIVDTSGHAELSGTSTNEVDRIVDTSGYAEFIGSAERDFELSYLPEEGATLSGAAEIEFELSYSPSEGITLSGSTIDQVDIIYDGYGEINLSGITINQVEVIYEGGGEALTLHGSLYALEINVLPLGGMLIDGLAAVQIEVIYSGIDGAILSGSANWQLGGDCMASGEAILNGATINQVEVIYIASGEIVFDGSFGYQSSINWVSSGEITINGASNNQIEIIYISSGEFVLSNFAIFEIETIYISSGIASLGGEATRGFELSYTASEGASLSGSSNWQLGGECIASGSATLSGVIEFTIEVLYGTSGTITISGAIEQNVTEISYIASGDDPILALSGSAYTIELSGPVSGDMTIGGSATNQIEIIFSFNGEIILNGNALTYRTPIEYIGSGGKELSGIVLKEIEIIFNTIGTISLIGVSYSTIEIGSIALGSATLSGTSTNNIDIILVTSGTIILSGIAATDKSSVYVAGGLTILSSTTQLQIDCYYVGNGIITILQFQISYEYIARVNREEHPAILADAEADDLPVGTEYTVAAGSLEVSTDAAIHGSYGYKFTVIDKTQNSLEAHFPIPSYTNPHLRMTMNLKNFSAEVKNSPVRFLTFKSDGGTEEVAYLDLYDLDNGYFGYRLVSKWNLSYVTLDHSASNIFALDTVYTIELHWRRSATVGGVEFWINDVSADRLFNAPNTNYPSIDGIEVGSLNCGQENGSIFYVDDIAVDDIAFGKIGLYRFIGGEALTEYEGDFTSYVTTGLISISGSAINQIEIGLPTAGNLTLSGSSTYTLILERSGNGEINISGITTREIEVICITSGTINLSGAAETYRDRFYEASGGITLSGTTSSSVTIIISTTGTATLSGAAIAVIEVIFLTDGIINLSGTSITSSASIYSMIMFAFAVFFGSALYEMSFETSASGGATLSGSALYTILFDYDADGIAFVLSGAAYVIGVYKTMEGGFTLSGAADTSRVPLFEYTSLGGIIISGSSQAEMSFGLIASGTININGSANWQRGGYWIGSGAATFGGSALIDVDTGILTIKGHALYSFIRIGYAYVPDILYISILKLVGAANKSYTITKSYSSSGQMVFAGSASYISSQFVSSGGMRLGGVAATVLSGRIYLKTMIGGIRLSGSASRDTTVVLEEAHYSYFALESNIFIPSTKTTTSYRMVSGNYIGSPDITPSTIHKTVNPAKLVDRVRQYVE